MKWQPYSNFPAGMLQPLVAMDDAGEAVGVVLHEPEMERDGGEDQTHRRGQRQGSHIEAPDGSPPGRVAIGGTRIDLGRHAVQIDESREIAHSLMHGTQDSDARCRQSAERTTTWVCLTRRVASLIVHDRVREVPSHCLSDSVDLSVIRSSRLLSQAPGPSLASLDPRPMSCYIAVLTASNHALRCAMPEPPFDSLRTPTPLLVGRSHEQKSLKAALEATAQRHGGLVLVSGEAGIGKTSLVEDLARQAENAGYLVLWGHNYDLSTTPPYGPWIEIVRRYQSVSLEPSIPALLDEPEALNALGSQRRLFAAATAFFAVVASQHPLVVILEDLHWADQDSLDLLRFLAREIAIQPILLIATYRSDDLTRHHPLAQLIPILVREARAERLEVPALDDRALQELIAHRYQLDDSDAARLKTHLMERADGNPFYISELLRDLEGTGVLA